MPSVRPGEGQYAVASKVWAQGAPCIEDGIVGIAEKQGTAPAGTALGSSLIPNVQIGESFLIRTRGRVLLDNPDDVFAQGDALYVDADGGIDVVAAAEVQLLTLTDAHGGTFTLTFDGQTTTAIAFGASTGTVQTALEALSNVAPGDIVVGGTPGAWTFTFGAAYDDENVPALIVDGALLTGPSIAVVTTVPGTGIANEKQTVTLSNATGGTFTITYSAQTTAPIVWNASTAVVQAALEALSNIAPGDVAVTGSAGAYTIEFTGTLALTNVAAVTANATGLTPDPTAAVTTTAQGSAGGEKFGLVAEDSSGRRGLPAGKMRVDLDAKDSF